MRKTGAKELVQKKIINNFFIIKNDLMRLKSLFYET